MKKRILIVDDDPLIRELVESILTAQGHIVTAAVDVLSALHILVNETEPESFDLIVSDVNMPTLTGFDLLDRLKANPATDRIPIIFLTGENQKESIEKGYSGGAEYYIAKPFTRLQLLHGLSMVFHD